MEGLNFWAILLVIAGSINLYFCYKFRTNEQFATNYVKKSPKALIWRKLWGEEKALRIISKVFVPVGAFISMVIIILGMVYLF